jgi:biotin operon repressor
VTAPDDVHHLLTGAGQVLDDLRYQEKDLEERLAAVRERLSAGQAVLAAVERWRSLPAGPVAVAPAAGGPVVDAGRPQPAMTERVALLLAQDPGRTWSPEQVHQALEVPVASVYSSMSRLEKRGRLIRVDHGAYRAAPSAGRG